MTTPTAEADTSKPAKVKKNKKSPKKKKEKVQSAKETTDPPQIATSEVVGAQQSAEKPSTRKDKRSDDADTSDDVKNRETNTTAATATNKPASPKSERTPRSTGDLNDDGDRALRKEERVKVKDTGDSDQGEDNFDARPTSAVQTGNNTKAASEPVRQSRASDETERDQDEKEEELGAAHRANAIDGNNGPEESASARTVGTAIPMRHEGKRAHDDAATARVQPMVESGSDSDSVRSDPLVIPTTARAPIVPSRTAPTVPTPEEPVDGNGKDPAEDPATRATTDSPPSVESMEAGNEKNMLFVFKIVLALVLLLSAAGAAVGGYYFALGLENEPSGGTSPTAEALNAQANLVYTAVKTRLEAVMSSVDDFQTNIVAQARFSNQSWPFVLFPNLAPAATRARYRAGGVHYMAIHPLVAPEQRQGWEAFGEAFADRWIVDSLQVQSTDELYEGPSLYDGNVLNVIHDSTYEPVPADYEVLFPTWQNSPVVARLPCYNWNLFSLENVGAVNRTYRAFRPVLGEAYTVPDPTDNELDVVEAKWWSDRFRDYVPFTKNPYEPISNLYYPIIDWDQSGLRTPQIFGSSVSGGPRFVGVLMMVLYWRDLLHDVALPPDSEPVDVVLTNPCHPPFTYRIHPGSSNNSSSTVYMGRDDAASNDARVSRSLSDLTDNYTSRESSLYTGLPLDSEYCPFTVSVRPPAAEASSSPSSPSSESGSGGTGTAAPVNPTVVAVVAAAIVGWTALVFVAYLATVNVYQRRRNTKQQDEDSRQRINHAGASTPASGSAPAAPPPAAAAAAAAPPTQQE